VGDDEEEPTGFGYIGGLLESIITSLHNIEQLLSDIRDAKVSALATAPPAPAEPPQPATTTAEPRKSGTKLSEMARKLKEKEEAEKSGPPKKK
jgi:hypothetical protein